MAMAGLRKSFLVGASVVAGIAAFIFGGVHNSSKVQAATPTFTLTGVTAYDQNNNKIGMYLGGRLHLPRRNRYIIQYTGLYKVGDSLPGVPMDAICEMYANGVSVTVDDIAKSQEGVAVRVTCKSTSLIQLHSYNNALRLGAAVVYQAGGGAMPYPPAFSNVTAYVDVEPPTVGLKLVKNVSNCTLSKLKARHRDCKIIVSYKAGDTAPGEIINAELKFRANYAPVTAVGLGPMADGKFHNYGIDLYDINGAKKVGRHNVSFSVFAKDAAGNTNVTSTSFEARVLADPVATPKPTQKPKPTTTTKPTATPTQEPVELTVEPSIEAPEVEDETKMQKYHPAVLVAAGAGGAFLLLAAAYGVRAYLKARKAA